MSFSPENLGVSEAGLPLLQELIHQRTGLYYANGRAELMSDRLAPLVVARGFRSYLELYYLLKFDERAGVAWREVMDALSVQETYFWREMDQVRALVCRVLPELAKTGRAPIRIWSSPCATGEEPLTIAMAIEEAGWFDRVPIEIHASDGSPQAISRARAGVYRQRSFRALPDHLREKYFTASGADLTPVAALSRRIASWTVVNLMDREQVLPFATSPVVFCRNAFIYFSRDSVKHVVSLFEEGMPAPGYLFVGASESLARLSDRFVLEDIERAFVYVKR